MLSKKAQDALNDQIQKEFASAYLYLAMAAHLENRIFPGMAHWMRVQAHEEFGHAMRLFDFVNAREGRVMLQAITQPQADFGTPDKVFEHVLEHERRVTESINKLYELAVSERDYPTQNHLQWFINEQVEEEKTAKEVLDKIRAAEGQGYVLLLLDQQLGQRQPATAT